MYSELYLKSVSARRAKMDKWKLAISQQLRDRASLGTENIFVY